MKTDVALVSLFSIRNMGIRTLSSVLKKDGLNIDLLITDLVMPGMNGRDLANNIQKNYKDLPVIFVSGYTDNHIVHHGTLDSDVHFIQKPYSIATLSKKIRELLDKNN